MSRIISPFREHFRSTEVGTESPAHALVVALTLVSESSPKVIGGALSEVQA